MFPGGSESGGEAWEQAAGLRAGGWGFKSWIPSRKQREWTQWHDLNSQSLSPVTLSPPNKAISSKPPQTAPSPGDQVSKYLSLRGHSHSNHQAYFFKLILKNCR